jgi:hypothetical protein
MVFYKKPNDAVIENIMGWRHSGFNIYCGSAIWPHDEDGLEKLARYIIRVSFSQERMTYIPAGYTSYGTAKVFYESKDGKTPKYFMRLMVNTYQSYLRFLVLLIHFLQSEHM